MDGNAAVKTEMFHAGRIWRISIHRPERKNSVDSHVARSLADAFIAFERDSTACVAILSGSSGVFCAGADLKALSDSTQPELGSRRNQLSPVDVQHPVEPSGATLDTTGPMGVSRMMLSKPVIASISGYCVAGGLELACWADLRIADLSSTFGVFCRRFGVPLIDGGTIRLPRLIGLSRAMDMILTGRAVSAQEALSFGLVNKVVESEKLESETMALAELICSFPQGCLRADRFSTVSAFSPSAHDPLRVHLKAEFDRGSAVIESESVLGAAAFASGEGRHGKWASKL